MIRFDNFKIQYAALKEELDTAVHRVLDSGWFIMGRELEAFEREFAQYTGCRYAVGVASGTDAITLSLMALDIGPGDEVITTDMTAFPTAAGIMRAGASPVTADISDTDGLIDPAAIEKKITPRTKAIVPVHLYGQSCDLDPILEIATKHRLQVVEDCAQSVGATYKNKMTGTYGAVNAFSFYPTKNLGAYGDAGAITTGDDVLYQKLLKLRNYGQRIRYHHDSFGINSRLDEMQAAVLRVKLKFLDRWNAKRREHAAYYREHLQSVTCLEERDYGTPVYHLFIIKTHRREKLMHHLKEKEIQTLIHYPVPIHRQEAMSGQPGAESRDPAAYPNSVRFAGEILSIPIYPELTSQHREEIVKVIDDFTG